MKALLGFLSNRHLPKGVGQFNFILFVLVSESSSVRAFLFAEGQRVFFIKLILTFRDAQAKLKSFLKEHARL